MRRPRRQARHDARVTYGNAIQTGSPRRRTQLFVTDVGASCAFYTKMLASRSPITYGEPAFYAQVVRDGARLNLRQVDEPAIAPALREREQLLSASITLEDAEPLYLEFAAAGADFAQALKTEPWGARTFVVRDPDGNLILFAA